MSFFIRKSNINNNLTTRKRPLKGKKDQKLASKSKGKGDKNNNKSSINAALNENISSDSDSEVDGKDWRNLPSEDEEDDETAQEKRLRLAKKYLEEIEREEAERADSKEVGHDVIAHRLKEDVLEQAGRLQKKVADELLQPDIGDFTVLRGHQLPVTCLVISTDGKHIYTGSKDCSIIKWNVELGKKVKIIPNNHKSKDKANGHSAHILSLALSSDNKFLASGCQKKLINIWNPETMEFIRSFPGHRDAVSGLTFRKGTHQLFSASFDRSVKIWNLDEMAYVETLFGHQDAITAIDSLTRDRAITSGGRDNTIRIWKVVEESQLVFNGHSGSIDNVRLINEENYVSGGDDGSLMLWSVLKKKPLVSVTGAHGSSLENQQPNWITSIAAMQNTDVVASGSSDGHIRFWKCGENFRTITPLFTLPVVGFVNALQFDNSGSLLVAGVGQEHRLGRWWRIKDSKNSVVIIPLKRRSNHLV